MGPLSDKAPTRLLAIDAKGETLYSTVFTYASSGAAELPPQAVPFKVCVKLWRLDGPVRINAANKGDPLTLSIEYPEPAPVPTSKPSPSDQKQDDDKGKVVTWWVVLAVVALGAVAYVFLRQLK